MRARVCRCRGIMRNARLEAKREAEDGQAIRFGNANVGVLLPEELRRRLKATAALELRDMSSLAEEAITEYLERRRETP